MSPHEQASGSKAVLPSVFTTFTCKTSELGGCPDTLLQTICCAAMVGGSLEQV